MTADLWLDPAIAPVLWLAATLVLYLIGVNLAARGRQRAAQGRPTIAAHPAMGWFVELARPLFYLGIPYAALLLGVVSPAAMGLAATIGWPQASVAVSIALAALAVALWSWDALRRHLPAYPLPRAWATHATWWGWPMQLREAGYLEMMWAFCRAACIARLGFYAGTFAALGVILLAGALNEALRRAARTPGEREAVVQTAGLAIVSTLLFYGTASLWLCLATHFALQFIVVRVAVRRARAVAAKSGGPR